LQGQIGLNRQTARLLNFFGNYIEVGRLLERDGNVKPREMIAN
jgi:hypothetical protein